jgi:hypothetical protein
VNKYQEQVSDRGLLLIDKLMQLLADALIRFRTWRQAALDRGGVLDKVVRILFPNVEADRSQ